MAILYGAVIEAVRVMLMGRKSEILSKIFSCKRNPQISSC